VFACFFNYDMFVVGLGIDFVFHVFFSAGCCEFGGQCQCSRMPGKTCLQNDQLFVKLYSLTNFTRFLPRRVWVSGWWHTLQSLFIAAENLRLTAGPVQRVRPLTR